jgi:hypothetical protein
MRGRKTEDKKPLNTNRLRIGELVKPPYIKILVLHQSLSPVLGGGE